MSTATTATAPVPGRGQVRARPLRWALAAEWVKLRSVRSTTASLAATLVACLGLAALIASSHAAHWDHMSASEKAQFDPTYLSLEPLFLAQLIVASLGVIAATSEWATGTIRSTLAAVPNRPLVALAKTVVLGTLVLVSGFVISVLSWLLTQAFLSTKGIQAHLGDPHVLRALVGGGLFLAAIALLGLGLGLVFRLTAAGIGAMVVLMFVAPILTNALPQQWQDHVAKLLPTQAGFALLATKPDPTLLSPWVGFAVLCLYAVVALAAGTALLVRRDP